MANKMAKSEATVDTATPAIEEWTRGSAACSPRRR